MITNAAMKNGFTGGLIVDYPNSKKAKKYYLFLMAGYSDEIMAEAKSVIMPKAKTENDSDDSNDSDNSNNNSDSDSSDGGRVNMKGRKNRSKVIKKKDKYGKGGSSNNSSVKGDKQWIMKKKER